MNICLRSLNIRTRKTTERVDFSEVVTFIHGPVSTGKSTVTSLIDYCLGGDLERTPAIQREFISAELSLIIGDYYCRIERAVDDTQSVRITWEGADGEVDSVNAPLRPETQLLLDSDVYNLSDLIFYLAGVTPIKVRKRSHDPDSPLIRLSFRDIWWYCYLEQTHLDSSFFRLEDTFRGRKSQDAMRFFTGLHSERLSQIEYDLMKTVDEQRTKREAVQQIRTFMARFDLESELDMTTQLQVAEQQLAEAQQTRTNLEVTRSAQTHPTDTLRADLRRLSGEVENITQAMSESKETISEQKSLRAELITAKMKAERAHQAGRIFEGVRYQRCPECGTDLSNRPHSHDRCGLCGSAPTQDISKTSIEMEALRRDLNERIDQISDSIVRRELEYNRMERRFTQTQQLKASLDGKLQEQLARYDSAFVENIRGAERELATLAERIRHLRRLEKMPQAVNELEEQAGSLQGPIDRLRGLMTAERNRLRNADANIAAIAFEFKRIMLSVSFPGVSEADEVVIDPRNWRPKVVHGDLEWTFWDTGSGGKKTLFNVCYALAIHAVALQRGLPVPSILIIDSPTKNISEDENPQLVQSLYREIYRLAHGQDSHQLQFLLIDSDIVRPMAGLSGFSERRMAGEPDAPSLIPYYEGP